MPASKLTALVLAAALAGAGTGCRAAPDAAPAAAEKRPLGLMTTLPIYWAEAQDVAELLQGGDQPAQARQALETRFVLEPLDTLDAETLKGLDRLLLAQPRVLAPLENVALDNWVRGGGRLLLFADPLLTRHSHFGIGDKRRAQDVALLSPILTRWGIALAFDPEQSDAERVIDVMGIRVPVAMAGLLRRLQGGGCEIVSDGVLARCRIGRGHVTIFADAAVLDDAAGSNSEPRMPALLRLAELAFD